MKRSIVVVIALTFAALAAGCGPAHIAEYTPKKRSFEKLKHPEDNPEGTAGSLWNSGASSGSLFADQRAFRVNDVVVVNVEEAADAQRSADTDMDRVGGSALMLAFTPVLPIMAALGVDLTQYTADVEGSSSSDTNFRSEGRTGRTERLNATVPSVVREVLPNGNLIIEGQRAVLVNSEEHHLYVSGVVRPIDIDQDNTIMSSQIAEAEIEFVGRGVISDNQQQGWASRYLGWAWPF